MDYKLPDHETLTELSKSDPKAVEKIRKEAIDAIIRSAPEPYKRRLRGLQFQIDMEVRRSKSPLDSCIRVSAMMHKTLDKMRDSMGELVKSATPSRPEIVQPEAVEPAIEEAQPTAKILPFEYS